MSKANFTHRKLWKVFLSLVAACFMIALIDHANVTTVLAADDEGKLTDTISWSITGDTLTISGTGAMPDCKYEADKRLIHSLSYSRYSTSVKHLVVQNGITAIGNYNFWEFEKLQSVSSPPTLQRIGSHAFEYCKVLTTINFPNSLVSIEDHAFERCLTLKSAILPNSLTKLGESAFLRCYELSQVTLSNNLTQIKIGTFSCCKIAKLIVPKKIAKIGDHALEGNVPMKVFIYNKNCTIYNRYDTFSAKSTIYGYKGSTAEKYVKKYAKKSGYKFKTISSSSAKKVKVTKLKITNAPKKLKAGRSKTLKVKVTPSNATSRSVTWKSSNKKYATVNSKGKVTAKKAGRGKTVKITATAKDGSKKKVTVKIKIS